MKLPLSIKTEAASPLPWAQGERFWSILAWVVALLLSACAIYLGWLVYTKQPLLSASGAALPPVAVENLENSSFANEQDGIVALPELSEGAGLQFISRRLTFHTAILDRTAEVIRTYVVEKGDSVFEIAKKFGIKPETVLWGNYTQLNDNPDLISVGMELLISPVDGVVYQWLEGDTLEAVAGRLDAKVEDILNWPGNELDLADPAIETDAWIIIPGGHREFRQWLIPTIPRGAAGVSRSVYGDGACEGSYDGALGTGTFIWPVSLHNLSGNDYWSGHLGIDIAASEGMPVVASDGGVVVFAGWASGGYGYTVMVDHGNGYQTLYGHLSKVAVGCGRSVGQGTTIGYAGSTGNSTGTHLHFEVRYLGGFISPWFVLPAP